MRSGVTAREFCRREGLAESAFHFWKRELVRRDAEQAAAHRCERGRERKGDVTDNHSLELRISVMSPFPELKLVKCSLQKAEAPLEYIGESYGTEFAYKIAISRVSN